MIGRQQLLEKDKDVHGLPRFSTAVAQNAHESI